MSRAMLALQDVGQLRQIDDDLRLAGRIHLFNGGLEDHLDAGLFALGQIVFDRPRVLVKVLARAKLGWIDENADRNVISAILRLPDERKVPGVQSAHGGNERKLAGEPGSLIATFGNGSRNDHDSFSLSSRAYRRERSSCHRAPRVTHRGVRSCALVYGITGSTTR